MISVETATERLLALVAPLPTEIVPLRLAAGRVLAEPVAARQSQPPFTASAMDGYAVAVEAPAPGNAFRVVGESAAGHPYEGRLAITDAVRIFTGAPLPEGSRRVLIQEDVVRDGDTIRLGDDPDRSDYIRPAGGDFERGTTMPAPCRLGSRDIALLAAMGYGAVPVARRPNVAIIMTGDELRAPGETLAPGQITASNGYGLAAMLEAAGAEVRLLPIARDRAGSLRTAFDLTFEADLVVTIGGASVGDHDLVAMAAGEAGLDLAFHKVAMRPGKPLLAGRLNGAAMVGLPGNPVSAMVCGVVFLLPMLRRMLGLPAEIATARCALDAPLKANGARQHYMRGRRVADGCVAEARQDSSLLSVLARADLLILRPPHDPEHAVGDLVEVIDLPA